VWGGRSGERVGGSKNFAGGCELPALILRLGKVAAVVVMAHGFRGERRAGAGRQAKEKEKEKRDQWGE